VGTAAALLKKYHCTPRELYQSHLPELRALLQKNDQLLPDRPVALPDDLIRMAALTASSTLTFGMQEQTGTEPLTWEPKSGLDPCDVPPDDRRKGQLFLLRTRELDSVRLLMNNDAGKAVAVTVHLRKEVFGEDLAAASCTVPPGKCRTAFCEFNLKLEPGTYALIIDPAESVSCCTSDIHLPGFSRKADGCYPNFQNLIMDILPEQHPFGIENLHNDYGRPSEGQPNIWIAEAGFPQTVTVEWDSPVTFDRLDLVFDTNLDQRRNFQVAGECIRDFAVEYEKDGVLIPLLSEKDNYLRFRRFDLSESITTAKLTVRFLASNGDRFARLYGIHAYRKTE
ncbi:MAG: hypothetical protein IKO93_15695, partial [Lentisphaeria bacterium]|nr:hypothetical protein [Lentisphaeria bacterium]